MLEVKDLKVYYGDALAVDGIALSVAEGEWVSMIGPNGAGKTSVIKAILGLLSHEGSVRVDGNEIGRLPPWARHRVGMAYVPEGRRLFPDLSVLENLHAGAYGVSSKPQIKKALADVFELFPRLQERRGQLARTLSGGEQQMVALGRALMSRPRLLLVDEASLGLMPLNVQLVFDALARLHSEGMAILLVEQNAKKALRHVDRAYVLEAGRMVMEGAASDVAADARVLESYVG